MGLAPLDQAGHDQCGGGHEASLDVYAAGEIACPSNN